jgi:hypothetical protein
MKIGDRNYSWTQPACDTCFAGVFPRVANPVRVMEEYRSDEICCMCGVAIRNGLYIRINPTTVDHPTEEVTG